MAQTHRRNFPSKLTRSLPPAYTRCLEDTDLGLDVFPVSPGKRILVHKTEWALANPDAKLVTENPMTTHAGVMLALDHTGSRHRSNGWEFSWRSARKAITKGAVSQTFDILGYQPDQTKSVAQIVGRLSYTEALPNSLTPEVVGSVTENPICGLTVAQTAVQHFQSRMLEGLTYRDYYGNKEIQRMVGATCTEPSRLGGRRIAQNRFFVQHIPSLGEQSPARRFLKVAEAIEQTFRGYTILTSPVSRSYESVRAMLSGVVEAVAQDVHRGTIKVEEHIEAIRGKTKTRNQREWRAKFRDEMHQHVEYLDGLLHQVDQIRNEAQEAVNSDLKQSYDELQVWASSERETLQDEVDLITESLALPGDHESTPRELRTKLSAVAAGNPRSIVILDPDPAPPATPAPEAAGPVRRPTQAVAPSVKEVLSDPRLQF